MKRLLPVLVSAVWLGACGEGPDPAVEVEVEDSSNVFEPLTDSIDRARAVEDTVREQEEELRRRIEEAEGQAN